MIRVGLTGSIGMGKSTVARMFADEGAPVYDADAAVHALYAQGGAAVAPVEAAFPGVVREGAVDRALLSARVVGDPAALAQLEAIVHPLVAQKQQDFLGAARAAGADIVILEIPLLLEARAPRSLDYLIVVSAPPEIPRARVGSPPGMTPEKFAAILARQLPDSEKRAQADLVIDTNGSLDETRAQVRRALAMLRELN